MTGRTTVKAYSQMAGQYSKHVIVGNPLCHCQLTTKNTLLRYSSAERLWLTSTLRSDDKRSTLPTLHYFEQLRTSLANKECVTRFVNLHGGTLQGREALDAPRCGRPIPLCTHAGEQRASTRPLLHRPSPGQPEPAWPCSAAAKMTSFARPRAAAARSSTSTDVPFRRQQRNRRSLDGAFLAELTSTASKCRNLLHMAGSAGNAAMQPCSANSPSTHAWMQDCACSC
mmetsp:Transcript_24211/g.71868  ORF Transcript_24211/g.71868 Transcript_24211/m.71868 type:complete len:227 (+) Transcript_24211:441-1121(+)